MKLSLVVWCCVFVKTFEFSGALYPNAGSGITTDWLKQPLDHFSSNNTRFWTMRYMYKSKYYKEGGPIFVIVGGQSPISKEPLVAGHFRDMAKHYQAYMFYTEHRYYGQSIPTPDLSNSNLKYLTSNQALADLATAIRTFKRMLTLRNAKVILSGSSYSGSLVVWFRHLYPSLVDGGWASSAPIVAAYEMPEFGDRIGDLIRIKGSQECYNRVENGIAELVKVFNSPRSWEAKQILHLCNNFNAYDWLDTASVFEYIMFELFGKARRHNITKTCESLMQKPDNLSSMADIVRNSRNFNKCLHVSYNDTNQFLVKANRAFFYQQCNEFGWFATAGKNSKPFGDKINFVFYTAMCEDIFGIKYNKDPIQKRIERTNQAYGGLDPDVTKIIFTHGELDPWRVVGQTAENGALIIPGAIHCEDLKGISLTDSAEMIKVKNEIHRLIGTWIKADICDEFKESA